MLEKWRFFGLAALGCAATLWAQGAGDAMVGLDHLPVSERIANALVSYVVYLWNMVWPANLAIIYPYPEGSLLWKGAEAGLLLLAISALAVWRMKRQPYLLVGWLWFLGTLVPVIGLVQVGIQSRADRYTYIPGIGILLMVAWGLGEVVERWSVRASRTLSRSDVPTLHGLLGSLAAAWLAVLIACSWLQLRHWRNSVALFSRAVEVTRENVRTEYLLAFGLNKQGDQAGAAAHYQKAIELQPSRAEATDKNSQVEAHLDLGEIVGNQGNLAESEGHFRAALVLQPGSWRAHSDLADCLMALGKLDEAIKEYRAALAGGHDNSRTWRLSVREGHASMELRAAQQNSEIWRRLAVALDKKGESAEALKAYREAVRLKPDSPAELNDLAWFLATDAHAELRNGEEAVRLAQKACELTGGRDPRCLGTLDAAYAEVGRFPDAIAIAATAAELARANGDGVIAAAAQQRLELYRAGKRYRREFNELQTR